MDETQPLLGLPAGAVMQDHPIFLRACHSPWRWLNQNILCYIRGGVLVYLIAVAGMLLDFKLQRSDEHSDWRIIFQFSTITWIMLLAYHVLVFSWTLTHLHWPDIDPNDQTWESRILRLMQPPQQTGYSRKRFYFSLFYTLVHVYSFMLVVIYWTILVPHGHGHLPGLPQPPLDPNNPPLPDPEHPDHPSIPDNFFSGIFLDGWFKPFCVLHMYTYPSLLALLEILFLNAIKRQVPVPSHIFAVQFFAGLYLGWAAIGKLLTGHNPFFWMDEKLVGHREVVAAYCVGFVVLSAFCFSFMYGLIGMRDSVAERADHDHNDNAASVRAEAHQQSQQSQQSQQQQRRRQ